jgi:hypothetical protein
VVEEMGGRILGAASGARRTDAAALARKRHKHLLTTRAAPHASKTAGENAAVDEAIELALHQPRHLMAALIFANRFAPRAVVAAVSKRLLRPHA